MTKVFQDSSQDTKIIVVISDTSIKNNITTSIAYIHPKPNIIAKTIYQAINVILTEAKLFAIRYRINQAVQVTDTSYIIVITNATYSVRYIFDLLSHPYQLQSITIAQDLRIFFEKNNNSIEFWNCPSNTK